MIPFQASSCGSIDLSTAKPPLILAVDDDADNLVLLDYALEPLRCEFVGKTDGHAALRFVQERQPDLILLDVIMPDMHGIELLHLLRQQPGASQIPVIAVTGMASPEDRTELLSEGFSDCLGKPYQVEELEATVQHYLQQRYLHQNLQPAPCPQLALG